MGRRVLHWRRDKLQAYSIYSSYQPGMMNPFSVGDMIALAFSSPNVFYCLTMFWRTELRIDRVISQYGFPLWRKTYTYTGIMSIDFKVGFIEVKNGPDKADVNWLRSLYPKIPITWMRRWYHFYE